MKIFVIAQMDLRNFLEEKTAYFWLFIAPLMFIFFTGMPGESRHLSGSHSLSEMAVENLDPDGLFSGILITNMLANGIPLIQESPVDRRHNVLSIPENFSELLESGDAPALVIHWHHDPISPAEELIVRRLQRTLFQLNSRLASFPMDSGKRNSGDMDSRIAGMMIPFPDPLDSRESGWVPVPSGFDHSFPANIIMFLLMNLLLFSASGQSQERRNGIFKRMGSFALHPGDVILGKFLGRLIIGIVFIVILCGIGKLVLGLSLFSHGYGIFLILFGFAFFSAALGVSIASMLSEPEKSIGVCVFCALVMSALGGCWWPVEITPPLMQDIAGFLPTGMAMNTLHGLISFGQPSSTAWEPFFKLLFPSIGLLMLAIRRFRFLT